MEKLHSRLAAVGAMALAALVAMVLIVRLDYYGPKRYAGEYPALAFDPDGGAHHTTLRFDVERRVGYDDRRARCDEVVGGFEFDDVRIDFADERIVARLRSDAGYIPVNRPTYVYNELRIKNGGYRCFVETDLDFGYFVVQRSDDMGEVLCVAMSPDADPQFAYSLTDRLHHQGVIPAGMFGEVRDLWKYHP